MLSVYAYVRGVKTWTLNLFYQIKFKRNYAVNEHEVFL